MNKLLLGLGGGLAATSTYGFHLKNRVLSGLEEPPYRIKGPLISVATPALEEEDYIGLLLQSVYNQTYTPLEVVVGDQSPPESKVLTQAVLDSWLPYLDVRMVDVPEKNVSMGRNWAVAASRGDPVLIIDSDCIMEPTYIEKLVGTLNKGAVLAHGVDCLYDDDFMNSLMSPWFVVKYRAHTTGRGLLIRRKDFEKVGGYREDFEPFATKQREDLDFGIRVEDTFGDGAVQLNRQAIVGESHRRPFDIMNLGVSERLWTERGWRNGRVIE